MVWVWVWYLLVVVAVVSGGANGANVSYDGRALIIDGQRRILFSGSIHYPRSTPDMWPTLISKAKQGGLDVIQTYVFWDLHEPQPGQYDFSGRNNLVRFIKEIQAQGLYASLRIGPFIEAEWTYGGLPFWLHDVPGIIYRSDNEPFKILMQNFTTKIVNLMKSEGLYASQGGPIILSQIENEYENVERAFHEKGSPSPYVSWAAAMAVGLQTGVPWVMCKQSDAPDPVINTCNGMKCGETFKGPNSPNKPSLWTENWTAYYQVYGQNTSLRSAEDLAYHTALFIANKNGSFVNYYMYYGGTNFGRTASAYTPTSYYDDAPLDEYGLIRQPKWGHLKELHAAVKLCSEALLYGGGPVILSLGQQQNAYIYSGKSGQCAAFLENSKNNHVQVQFQNTSYELPSKSISILPDCKTVAFNTAKVTSQFNTRSMQSSITFGSAASWQVFKEDIPHFDDTSLRSSTLLEQTDTTKDTTDYLWYTFRYQHDHSPAAQATLRVNSAAHVLHAYVNGVLVGSAHGQKNTNFSLLESVTVNNGTNNISLLSIMTGLRDSGAYLEHKGHGLFAVTIQEPQKPSFTSSSWGYQVGLTGEKLQVYIAKGSRTIQWSPYISPQPLTWYKTVFDAPSGSDPVALNLGSMGKGEVWINGQSIGRYWVSFHTPADTPTQTWYNIPRSFLKHKGNLLVLLEEEEHIDPLDISVDIVSITNVCGLVSDSHPPPVISWKGGNIKTLDVQNDKHPHGRRPKIQLHCPPKKTISRIVFASYGTPMGDCTGQYSLGSCHSSNSGDIVEKACLGKKKCSIPQSSQMFGVDPCPGTPKSLLVVAQCK